MSTYLLAIDQGTTSTRAMVFDGALTPLATAQQEFPQHYPAPGLVEHDAEDIWNTTLGCIRGALEKAKLTAKDIAAIGISNQRETTVLWDRASGKPIYNAIVWQDRRTAAHCAALKEQGHETAITAKTGLLLDPYFSATKIAWLLDNVQGARQAAEAGKLAFGTIESFLLYRLTGGAQHASDATNASRTLLFDIHKGRWDAELCALFRIPMNMLPEVRDCAADYGHTKPGLFGHAIPITGMAGDQQAAAIGQGCFKPGMMKATYGTGCFALLNTGEKPVASRHKLLTTIAYQLGGKRCYALEGSIFMAGATVQWLRDKLKIIGKASEADELAALANPDSEVVLVPAFVGLGAPWWDAEARGAIFGLTRGDGAAEITRAALEAVGFQTRDLLDAMQADWPEAKSATLRVDGGMSVSAFAMQFLADILGAKVERPKVMETTALGAAYLAGLHVGLMPAPEAFAARWKRDTLFTPSMPEEMRTKKRKLWGDAVGRVVSNK